MVPRHHLIKLKPVILAGDQCDGPSDWVQPKRRKLWEIFLADYALLSRSKEKLNIKGQKINIYALTAIKRLNVLVHHGLLKCEDE